MFVRAAGFPRDAARRARRRRARRPFDAGRFRRSRRATDQRQEELQPPYDASLPEKLPFSCPLVKPTLAHHDEKCVTAVGSVGIASSPGRATPIPTRGRARPKERASRRFVSRVGRGSTARRRCEPRPTATPSNGLPQPPSRDSTAGAFYEYSYEISSGDDSITHLEYDIRITTSQMVN